MIYKYSDFLSSEKLINEGSSYRPTLIYYNDELKIDREWYELKVEKNRPGLLNIRFRVKNQDEAYNYYFVLLKHDLGKEEIYMDNSDKFKEKFKHEFFKNAHEYIKDFKWEPKFLGDLQHVKDSGKYNL